MYTYDESGNKIPMQAEKENYTPSRTGRIDQPRVVEHYSSDTNKKIIIWSLVGVAIIILIVVAYFAWKKYQKGKSGAVAGFGCGMSSSAEEGQYGFSFY